MAANATMSIVKRISGNLIVPGNEVEGLVLRFAKKRMIACAAELYKPGEG